MRPELVFLSTFVYEKHENGLFFVKKLKLEILFL